MHWAGHEEFAEGHAIVRSMSQGTTWMVMFRLDYSDDSGHREARGDDCCGPGKRRWYLVLGGGAGDGETEADVGEISSARAVPTSSQDGWCYIKSDLHD